MDTGTDSIKATEEVVRNKKKRGLVIWLTVFVIIYLCYIPLPDFLEFYNNVTRYESPEDVILKQNEHAIDFIFQNEKIIYIFEKDSIALAWYKDLSVIRYGYLYNSFGGWKMEKNTDASIQQNYNEYHIHYIPMYIDSCIIYIYKTVSDESEFVQITDCFNSKFETFEYNNSKSTKTKTWCLILAERPYTYTVKIGEDTVELF